jgi:multisubunit Na+/H+ antiporter MnhG subunit
MVVPAVAAVAGIITAAILYRIGATDAVGALLVACFVTLVAAYCENIFAQAAENERTEAELNHLGKSHEAMRSDADSPAAPCSNSSSTSTTASPRATIAW